MNDDVTPNKFVSVSDYLEARGYKIEDDCFVNPDNKDDKITAEEIMKHTPSTLAEKKGWTR
jgi:hypothetical protein